ncbi:MAG: glycosyltransferase [Alphaproteobacteria bacterium]|nr:glycosyltransferase [Alphaproteobacteria bacterium]
MRILHIMAGNGNGGAEMYSTDVMLALHEKGVDQCVVMRETAPRYQELKNAGIRMAPEVFRFAFSIGPFRPVQNYMMRRVLLREKPDITHCWMRRAANITPALAAKTGPLLGWFGNYENIKHFSHCTDFVAVTKDIIAKTIAQGAAPEHATYIPTFPSIVDMPALDRATLDTPTGAKVLLTLSRLHPKKGLDLLMYAVKDFPDCYLWLAGDGPMQKELEDLAVTLGIQQRVRFLGWRTDRGALLKAADICVLPSNYEPFGTVILEAWCAKVPFVACESAGPAAHIINEENGMMVPINDASALGHAIRRTLDDSALQEKMVARGYAEYMQSFTREAVTQRWLSHYDHLLNQFPHVKTA